MKLFRILAVVLALILVLGMTLPAFAQTPPDTDSRGPKPVKPFEKGKLGVNAELAKFKTIKGTVTEVAPDKIKVDNYELFFDTSTRVKVPTLSKAAALADIKVGMLVIVLVYEKDGKLYIRHINVIPGKPVMKHHVGEVVEYVYDAATGGKITIKPKSGENVTFEILPGKFKILPEGAEVKIGSIVTVISPRDPATNRLIASGVVVHIPKPVPPPPVQTEKVSGVINAIDETAKTIKIGETVVTYNEKTLIAMRGLLAVKTGQEAVAFCIKKEDGTLVALRLLVGVDLPQIMAELGAQLGKTERDRTRQTD